jgi:hypothetical protein
MMGMVMGMTMVPMTKVAIQSLARAGNLLFNQAYGITHAQVAEPEQEN